MASVDSSPRDEPNSPVLVAVVEIPHADGTGSRLRKIRMCERSCTGWDLFKAIVDTFVQENDDRNGAQVDIFDARQARFVSLLDLRDSSILEKFGPRVRCVIRERQSNIKTSLPAIAGRYYAYNDAVGLEIAGKRVVVKEMPNIPGAGTGVNVWDGAILLARYLEHQPDVVRGKRVLELGSGCGMVGIVSGLLGATEVVLTDLPYTLPLMKENVHRHMDDLVQAGCRRIECVECDWFNPCSMSQMGSDELDSWQADVLLLADCVWVHELVAPLLNTMKKLISEAKSPIRVVISYQQRGKSAHEAFLGGLYSLFTHVAEIDVASIRLEKPDVLTLMECRP